MVRMVSANRSVLVDIRRRLNIEYCWKYIENIYFSKKNKKRNFYKFLEYLKIRRFPRLSEK